MRAHKENTEIMTVKILLCHSSIGQMTLLLK